MVLDEDSDTMWLISHLGEKINVNESFEEAKVDDCFAITAGLGFLIGLLFVGGVYVFSAPTIVDKISDGLQSLWEGAKGVVTSFWEKIRLAFGAITANKAKSEVKLDATTIATIYERSKNREDCYILVDVVINGQPLTTKYTFTDIKNARNWMKQGGSVWSPTSSNAKAVIRQTGYYPGGYDELLGEYVRNKSENHSKEKYNIAYFEHYHLLTRNNKRIWNNVHSFFGLPVVV